MCLVMNEQYVIKHIVLGTVRKGFLTAFPMAPTNFVSEKNKRFHDLIKVYDSFGEASVDVQAFFSSPRGSVEVVAYNKSS